MYRQVYDYLERFSIISENQYGFRSRKSMEQAILKFINFLYSTLDSIDNVVAIFSGFFLKPSIVSIMQFLLSKLYH